MTDFIWRLVNRGLGVAHAGTPIAEPAQSGVGVDAKLDKTTPRTSTPEMLDATESPPPDRKIAGPAIDSRRSSRPNTSPVLATPFVDLSQRTHRTQQPGKTLRNSEPEPKTVGNESPVDSVNQLLSPRRTSMRTSEVSGVVDAPTLIVPIRPAAVSRGVTHPESTRADSPPNLSPASAAISATPQPDKEQRLPDADKTRERNRHGALTIHEASTDEGGDLARPINLSLVERPTPTPRSTDKSRDSGDAAPLRPAPPAAPRPAVVLEASRPRTNTGKDSALQPLSPRVQRPADLAAIMASGRTPAAERSVSVRIGTIEVRTEAPAPVAPPTPPSAPPAPGFEEYAALRSYTRWSTR